MAAGSGKEMEIAIKIAGQVKGSFKNALSQAAKGLGGITKAVSSATAAAAAAVGALGVAAINVGKEFETSMSQVAATMLIDKSTTEGAEKFSTLEEAARKCGRETAFSATEAAEALNNLAMAGYDATDAATALPTVLNLAGAGGLELADSARYITASLASLGIEKTEDNFKHFADTLAITASNASTNVSQMGEAITTLGGTGKGLKGGTEEIAAALGILADNDITGSEGGTHLRNMILSLQNPRNANAAKMFQQLGIEAYNSEGKMRGLNEIFSDINKSMTGMTDQQKNDVMSTIFKQTDLAAANALLADCGNRFNELYEAAYNSSEGIGAAAKMYATQTDNLEGDIDILKSALSEVGISISKDLNGPLREMTQLATSMVGELSEAYKDGGMEGMIGAVGGCLSEAVNEIAGYVPKLVSTGVDLLENFIGGITDNSGMLADAAADVLSVFVEGLFSLVPQVILAGIDLVTELAGKVTEQLPQLITSGTQAVTNFVNGIIQRLPAVITMALTLVQTLVNSIGTNAPQLLGAAIRLMGGLLNGIAAMLPQIANMAVQLVTDLAGAIIENVPLLIDTAVQLVLNLINGLLSMLPQILQSGVQLVMNLLQGIIAALPEIAEAGVQLIEGLVQGLVSNLPAILQAAVQMIMQIIQGIAAMLPRILRMGMELIQKLADGIISSLPAVMQAAIETVTQFINSLVQMLPEILQTGATMVQGLVSGITSQSEAIMQTSVNIVVSLINTIVQMLPVILQAGIDMISTLLDGIIANLPMIIQAGINVIGGFAKGLLQMLPTIIQSAIQLIIAFVGGIIQAIPVLLDAWMQLIATLVTALIDTDWIQVGKDVLSSIKDGIISMASSLGTSIKDSVLGLFGFGGSDKSDNSAAVQAGQEIAAGYADGILNNAAQTADAANQMTAATFGSMDYSAVAAAGTESGTAFTASLDNSIKAYTFDTSGIGADTGALSADMMAAGQAGAAAVGNGFSNNAQEAAEAAAGMADEINNSLDCGWDKAVNSAEASMGSLVDAVKAKAQEAANAVKSAFEGMTITIPKPKIPVISTSYRTENYGGGGSVSLPQFCINWNAAGGIFSQATILNTASGLQGVGEAGAEAVLPLDILWTEFRNILSDALQEYSGQSVIESLVAKLQNIKAGNGSNTNDAVPAGAGGVNITYAPTYQLYGSAAKEDAIEAEKLSQAEFNRMMKQWQHDSGRKKF